MTSAEKAMHKGVMKYAEEQNMAPQAAMIKKLPVGRKLRNPMHVRSGRIDPTNIDFL